MNIPSDKTLHGAIFATDDTATTLDTAKTLVDIATAWYVTNISSPTFEILKCKVTAIKLEQYYQENILHSVNHTILDRKSVHWTRL